MAYDVSLPTTYYSTVLPVVPVEPVVARQSSAPTVSVVPNASSSLDSLRKARADALAELQAPSDEKPDPRTYYRGLDRDQLASMVYDRQSRFSLGERRSAQSQLQANDTTFLDRAKELTDISGDERVLLNAQLVLEQAKSPIERAVPRSEAGPSILELGQQIAEATAELGGEPVGISLSYPNGWAGAPVKLGLPDESAAANVSPGATRMALRYRESLF